MENEKPFSKNIELAENKPISYSVRFDESHFDDHEIPPEIVRYWTEHHDPWIPGAASEWWRGNYAKNKLDIENDKLEEMLYFMLEVVRNAFEKVGSGEIKVIFEQKKIIIIVTDLGCGFEIPNGELQFGHGLEEVKEYADEFIVESNGKKFTKVKGQQALIETRDTDVHRGSKITFAKNFA